MNTIYKLIVGIVAIGVLCAYVVTITNLVRVANVTH
jgi:hypothetical protein